jgi:hypothetical protein
VGALPEELRKEKERMKIDYRGVCMRKKREE